MFAEIQSQVPLNPQPGMLIPSYGRVDCVLLIVAGVLETVVVVVEEMLGVVAKCRK